MALQDSLTRAARFAIAAALIISTLAVDSIGSSGSADALSEVPPLSAPIPFTISVEQTEGFYYAASLYYWYSVCDVKVWATFDVDEWGTVNDDTGIHEVLQQFTGNSHRRFVETVPAVPGERMLLLSRGGSYIDPAKQAVPPTGNFCEASQREAYVTDVTSEAANLLWTVDERPLRGALDVAHDNDNAVGDSIPVTLTLSNAGIEPVESVVGHNDVGLQFDPGEFEMVNGPTPAIPTTLAPGATIDIAYEVRPLTGGRLRLDAGATGTYGGLPVHVDLGQSIDVAPPLEIIVESAQTSTTAPNDVFEAGVTIRNISDQPVVAVKPDSIEGTNPGSIAIVEGPLAPGGEEAAADGYELEPGESIRFTYQVRLLENTYPLDITARVSAREPVTQLLFFASGVSVATDELGVEIAGERDGSRLTVTTTITNLTDEPVTGLATSGVIAEAVGPTGSDLPVANPLSLHGHERAPTTLGPLESVDVVTEYLIVGVGLAVLSETVVGTGSSGEVGGNGVVSVEITQTEATVADAEQFAIDGMANAFEQLAEATRIVDDQFAEELAVLNDADRYAPEVLRDLQDFENLGFTHAQAERLALWRAEGNHVNERADAWWEGFKAKSAERGSEAQQAAAGLFTLVTNPAQAKAVATSIWDSGITNLHLLGDVAAMSGPELISNTNPWVNELAAELAEDIQFAWTGSREVNQLDRNAMLADPQVQSRVEGRRVGEYTADGVIDAGIAITGEIGSVATVKLAGAITRRVVGAGIDSGMSVNRGRAITATGAEASDTVSDLAVRLRRLEDVEAGSLRHVPTGSQLPLDENFARATGLSTDDAVFFQGVVESMNRDFPGNDFQVGFRTAEADSISLVDVVGKEEWNKFKAVGALDEVLGARSSMRGQASVFDPVPLTGNALDALEATNPGFTQRYLDRYQTQKKNWSAYEAGTTKMNEIIDGSIIHGGGASGLDPFGGIRIINDRPGYDSHGITYIEQLTEEAYLDQRGISPERALQLYDELSAHPGLTRPVNVVEQRVAGAVSFAQKYADGSIVAIGSDFDLQFFGPANGVWSNPAERGQIVTEFMRRLGKNPRVPAHGASDMGFDMSVEAAVIRAEFEMLPYHPGAGAAKADQILDSFSKIVVDLRRRAGRVEADAAAKASTDPEVAAELLARAQSMRASADRIELVTKADLLKMAKGEKLVVITPGDIRVGGGYE